MITCYNCGKQVSDETLICPECGALVRRYDTPPQTAQPETPVQAPPAPAPVRGAFRYSAGQKVWLWLCIVCCAYAAVMTGLCYFFLHQENRAIIDIIQETLQSMGLTAELELVGTVFLVTAVYYLIRCTLYTILVFTQRRWPLLALIALSLLLTFGNLIAGASVTSIFPSIGVMITLLVLRRNLHMLK